MMHVILKTQLWKYSFLLCNVTILKKTMLVLKAHWSKKKVSINRYFSLGLVVLSCICFIIIQNNMCFFPHTLDYSCFLLLCKTVSAPFKDIMLLLDPNEILLGECGGGHSYQVCKKHVRHGDMILVVI